MKCVGGIVGEWRFGALCSFGVIHYYLYPPFFQIQCVKIFVELHVCSNGCAMYFVIVRYTVRDVTMCILQRGEPYDLMLLVRPFMLDKKRAGPVTCPWACQSKQHRI